MGRVILFTSGKGGTGKTTLCAGIGLALSRSGKRVCIVDGDLGLRNMDVVLGLELKVINNLMDVIEGQICVNEALIDYPDNENLKFISAPQTADKYSVTPQQMQGVIDSLRDGFDYILLDCPTGIERGFANVANCADLALVIATPDRAAIRDADKIKTLLRFDYKCEVSLLVNRYRKDLAMQGLLVKYEEISDILGLDLLGIIPEDDSVLISSNLGQPIDFTSPAGQEFLDIVRRLEGESLPLGIHQAKKGLFGRKR